MTPRIGISVENCEPDPHFGLVSYGVDREVCYAIHKAGGLPVAIPQIPEATGDYLDGLDALVLTGGSYSFPRSWYAETDYSEHYTATARFDFERNLLALALDRHLPILGICAGMQLISGHLGGKMTANLPTGDVNHWRTDSLDNPVHNVLIEENSLLAEIVGTEPLAVNSFHREAVKMVADNVVINARSPDGTVEGIELPDREFVLAVQWHPEQLCRKDERQAAIFSALVESSAARSGDRSLALSPSKGSTPL